MNRHLLLTISLMLLSTLTSAHAVTRAALVDQVEATYASTALFSSDSPILEMMLAPGKAANPNVTPDTWLMVKADAATAMTKVFTEKGSMLDVVIRQSLESLTDKELRTLNQLLSEPVYRKFQAAMSNPSTQRQMMTTMMQAGLKMAGVINAVLVSHHLNEAH